MPLDNKFFFLQTQKDPYTKGGHQIISNFSQTQKTPYKGRPPYYK